VIVYALYIVVFLILAMVFFLGARALKLGIMAKRNLRKDSSEEDYSLRKNENKIIDKKEYKKTNDKILK